MTDIERIDKIRRKWERIASLASPRLKNVQEDCADVKFLIEKINSLWSALINIDQTYYNNTAQGRAHTMKSITEIALRGFGNRTFCDSCGAPLVESLRDDNWIYCLVCKEQKGLDQDDCICHETVVGKDECPVHGSFSRYHCEVCLKKGCPQCENPLLKGICVCKEKK